jgi:DsbC/DsbD-like thiol-disulfide interchange protein
MKASFIFVSFVFSLSAWALEPAQHLMVTGVKKIELRASGSGVVVVELKVHDGFHVQANPASKPNLIATKVDIAAVGQIEVGRASYPKPKPYKVAGLETEVGTYDGLFEVRVPVQATAKIQPGKYSLDGKVRYQACDDKVCFPPTILRFAAPIEVR